MLLLLPLLAFLFPAVAAHVSGRGFILLLPTNLFIAGGALVVAASFALLALIPVRRVVSATEYRGKVLVVRSARVGVWISVASLVFVLFLVFAGWYGSRDPLENPAPLFIWFLWWPGMTIITALLGNVWAVLNPWTGVYELLMGSKILRRINYRPPLRYPEKLGYIPSIAVFFAFAWVELVHPYPADPEFLSTLIAGYLLYNFIGLLLFGKRIWLQYCEAFSVFFEMVSWISPIAVRDWDRSENETGLSHAGVGDGRRVSQILVTLPTANLARERRLRLSHTIFIILALSTVSFDGFSRTFTWLSIIGVNPLDYPGRTLLMGANSVGMLATFSAIAAAYILACWLAKLLVFHGWRLSETMGLFVPSIVPIALGYHIAHYFPYVLANFQTVYASFSDPFELGWNLLGVSGVPAIPSFLKDPYQVYYVYYAQVGLIVLVHVLAVYIAHVIALREVKTVRAAMLSQIPMMFLMVGYTMFGLWLLSSPSVD